MVLSNADGNVSHRGTKGQENGNGNGYGGGGGGWAERGDRVSDGVRQCRGGGIVWYRVESSLCTAMTQSESVRDTHGRTERHLHSVVMRMQWEYPRVYRDHGVYKDERKRKKKVKDVVWRCGTSIMDRSDKKVCGERRKQLG